MRVPLPRGRLRLAATVLAAAALAGAGCSDSGEIAGSGSPSAPATSGTAASATAIVHYLDDSGRLVAERRPVAGPLDVEAALTALAEGPEAAGLTPALPPGAALRSASVTDVTATADFTAAFEDGYPPGGAAAELAVLAPIIYTATGVSGVRDVRITVEGRVPEPRGSQVDFSQPLSRADFPVTVVRAP